MRSIPLFLLSLLALTLAPVAAGGQQRPASRYHVTAAVGRTEYDLANAVA